MSINIAADAVSAFNRGKKIHGFLRGLPDCPAVWLDLDYEIVVGALERARAAGPDAEAAQETIEDWCDDLTEKSIRWANMQPATRLKEWGSLEADLGIPVVAAPLLWTATRCA